MVNIARVFCTAMSLRPPTHVRNMTVLDRARFTCNVDIPVLKVNLFATGSVSKLTKKYFLKLHNFRPVQDAPKSDESEDSYKIIYLNPDQIKQWQDIEEDIRNKLSESSVDVTSFEKKNVTLTYDNWPSDEIFKAVLPEDSDIVSGYSLIGHIVHLNLRDRLLPYRFLVGAVLLDKVKPCRIVVNKSDIIDNTYRNFAMEVIAGEEDFNVTVKENGISFQFDFSKVYWNPRLGREHDRIVKLLKPGDVLFDVFCGVGPFAIPAAKKKCFVYANDLNPESFKWLNHNVKFNKVRSEYLKSYNMDGSDFLKEHFKNFLIKVFNGNEKLGNGAKIHLTMNLPAMAVTFLNVFRSLLTDVDCENVDVEIIVHVYCFAFGVTPECTAKEMVNENLGYTLSPEEIVEVFNVRNVAPKKEMMRVSFRLTKALLCANIGNEGVSSEPPSKRKCT